MKERRDLMAIFNAARFSLRHYAKGYYPVDQGGKMTSMPLNRLFMPLENPKGSKNYIAEVGRKHILEPGNLYYIPAFLPVEFCLDDQLFFLSIQNNFEVFPGVEMFSGCSRMTVIPNPPQVTELLELIESDGEHCFADALRAGSLILSMQSLLLDHYPEEEFWKPLALREFSPLMEFLKDNGTARTAVSDLAALRKESRENFTRHFIRRTGITPKQLIDRFVINRCLDLLNNGHSIKETAQTLQFSNEFVFSRYFKRNMGESPSFWLKHHRSG